NKALGDWQGAPCDTLLTNTKGIAPGEQRDLLRIYPNPAHQNVTLDIVLDGEKTVTFVNAVGQIIRQETINANQLKVQLNDFNRGLYFVLLSQDGSLLEVKRFIRQ
ncbi:MAG: T9SS type A sorting domain-containing protein, partial [Phaeodactylibacter sp.]|nr:T9SS type A sorting domain-containing protein [Phaeodactylibacter sp.]